MSAPKPVRGYVAGKSTVCLEGFPRSGNSTLFRKFRMANPAIQPPEIVHHTHQPAPVIKCIEAKLPCLVLIREPLDAIASYIEFTEAEHAPALRRYRDYYGELIAYHDRIVMVRFETMLKDFNTCVRALNRKFGTDYALLDIPDEEANDESNRMALESGPRIHGDKWEQRIGAPRAKSDRGRICESLNKAPVFQACLQVHRDTLALGAL